MSAKSRYATMDCTDIVRGISRGAFSRTEIRSCAIEHLQGIMHTNAIEEIYHESVTTSALSGPLNGVPALHKDSASGMVRSLVSSEGSLQFSRRRSEKTSLIMEKMLNAGCEIVGRSRVPELTLSVTGDNISLGSVRNPFNEKFSMGGSTAGVAAVSLGAVPVAQGSDAGGSLRIPAAWGGCYTLKPTTYYLSRGEDDNSLFFLDQPFVAVRSIRDLRLFYSIFLEEAHKREFSTALSEPLFGTSAPKMLCVGSLFSGKDLSAYNAPALESIMNRAINLGFTVRTSSLDYNFDEYCEVLYNIFSADVALMAGAVDNVEKAKFQSYIKEWIQDASSSIGTSGLYGAFMTQSRYRREFVKLMADYDFLLMPVTASGPPLIDTTHGDPSIKTPRQMNMHFEEMIQFCAMFNITGLPSVSFPAGFDSNGVPIGMQVIGRHGDELRLMMFAELICDDFRMPDN